MAISDWKTGARDGGWIIGHRGAPRYETENTRESFEFAIKAGLPAIELDVWLVEDQLVVFHDHSLARITGFEGDISTTKLHILKTLKAGKSGYIPMLEEIMELCQKRCSINIELKGPNTECAVQKAVTAACGQGWKKNQFLISSFDHSALMRLRKLDDEILIGLLTEDTAQNLETAVKTIKPFSIHAWDNVVDDEYLAYLNSFSLPVFIYTVNDRNRCHALFGKGIRGVFSDDPYLINSQKTVSGQ